MIVGLQEGKSFTSIKWTSDSGWGCMLRAPRFVSFIILFSSHSVVSSFSSPVSLGPFCTSLPQCHVAFLRLPVFLLTPAGTGQMMLATALLRHLTMDDIDHVDEHILKLVRPLSPCLPPSLAHSLRCSRGLMTSVRRLTLSTPLLSGAWRWARALASGLVPAPSRPSSSSPLSMWAPFLF